MSNDTCTVTGASKNTYTFEVFPWGTKFNPVGAVYLVLGRKNGNGSYPLIYIGETGDLSSRFDNHHQQPCFDRNGRANVGVLREGSGPRRLTIEADIRNAYKTSCNEQ